MPVSRPPNRLLALCYLLLALPLSLRLALLTPPLQAADEAEHVMRAAQVGAGGLAGQRAPDGQVGGILPLSLDQLRKRFYTLRFRPLAPGSPALSRAAAGLDWTGPRGFLSFANTAIYPPVFYLPASVALDAGRGLHLRLLPSLTLARLVDATLASLIAAAAILIAEAAPALLAAILALPMSLSLFASCSQDAMLIAASALAAAWLGQRQTGARPAMPLQATALPAAGLLIGCLGAARPPYLVLAVLPLLVSRPGNRRPALIGSLLGLAFALLWIVFAAAPCLTPTRAGGSLLGGAQMRFLLHHPLAVPPIAWYTLSNQGATLLRETIGVLDWLDVALPAPAYGLAGLILVALVALEASTGLRRAAWAIAGSLLAAAALIFAVQYLSWTPTGARVVEGVQGRYFIPLLLMATILLPGGHRRGRGWVSVALLALLLILDWHYMPAAIATHYALAASPP